MTTMSRAGSERKGSRFLRRASFVWSIGAESDGALGRRWRIEFVRISIGRSQQNERSCIIIRIAVGDNYRPPSTEVSG